MAPIHYAVKSGNLNQVKALLNQGVPVNSRDEHGATPLHWAAWMGRSSVVQELLKRGAHVNPRTRSGMTPLHVAALAKHPHPHIIHELMKAGTNPTYGSIYGHRAHNIANNRSIPNALKTSRAVTKWQNTVRKRKAERMLLSPRLLGSKPLNNNAIRSIARYLTVKKKNIIRKE